MFLRLSFCIALTAFFNLPSSLAQTREEVMTALRTSPTEAADGAYSIGQYEAAVRGVAKYAQDREVLDVFFEWLGRCEALIRECAEKTGQGKNASGLTEIASRRQQWRMLEGWLSQLATPLLNSPLISSQEYQALEKAFGGQGPTRLLEIRIAETRLAEAHITPDNINYRRAHQFLSDEQLKDRRLEGETTVRVLEWLQDKYLGSLVPADNVTFLHLLAGVGNNSRTPGVDARLLSLYVGVHGLSDRSLDRPTLELLAVAEGHLPHADAFLDRFFGAHPSASELVRAFETATVKIAPWSFDTIIASASRVKESFRNRFEFYFHTHALRYHLRSPEVVNLYIDQLAHLARGTPGCVQPDAVITFLNEAQLARDSIAQVRRLLRMARENFSFRNVGPQLEALEKKVEFLWLGRWRRGRNTWPATYRPGHCDAPLSH